MHCKQNIFGNYQTTREWKEVLIENWKNYAKNENKKNGFTS
jgi:hypothetical protein